MTLKKGRIIMTVGNTAKLTVNMSQVQTKYGDQLNSIKTKYASKYEGSSEALDKLLSSKALKSKSDEFRTQFSNLYKSIYNISDDSDSSDSVSTTQSVKTSSSAAGSAAQSIKSYANSLKYGGEIDTDAYKKQAQSFVDSYNAMVEKVGNSENQQVLQKGVLMVNTAKVYSSALERAGMTLGSDNKLTLSSDLSKVSATDVKSTFGTNGFSDKVIQKASQINQLSGGSGVFASNYTSSASGSTGSSSTDKVDNAATLKVTAQDVKDASSAITDLAKGLTNGDEFDAEKYADTANKFVESFNKMLEEAEKSDKTSVNQKGSILESTANAYKHALKRAGIDVGSDNRLTVADDIKSKTAADVKYAFGYGGFADKVSQKASQIYSLVGSAKEMGYNSNSTYNYAYTSGALYSVYA